MLLSNKWDRMYFFTQGGNLMSQTKEEVSFVVTAFCKPVNKHCVYYI